MTSLPDTTSKAIHYEADEGPTIWFNKGMYTFKATGETTGEVGAAVGAQRDDMAEGGGFD